MQRVIDLIEHRITAVHRGRRLAAVVVTAACVLVAPDEGAAGAGASADHVAPNAIVVPSPSPSPSPLPAPPTVQPSAEPSTSPTPADTTPPETTIGSASGRPRTHSVTFTFSSSEAGATFECALDDQTSACTSPLTLDGLARRSHTFSVVAIDAAGNEDPSPSVVEFRPRRRRWRWRCSGAWLPCVPIRA